MRCPYLFDYNYHSTSLVYQIEPLFYRKTTIYRQRYHEMLTFTKMQYILRNELLYNLVQQTSETVLSILDAIRGSLSYIHQSDLRPYSPIYWKLLSR